MANSPAMLVAGAHRCRPSHREVPKTPALVAPSATGVYTLGDSEKGCLLSYLEISVIHGT